MLRRIEVNGFKTLNDFSLEFRPGLNILVGPNGAGKTNVLKFLEFVSILTGDSLSNAIGRLGGAGNVFLRKQGSVINSTLSFALTGDGNTSDIEKITESQKEVSFNYEYNATVKLRETDVVFTAQSVRVWLKGEYAAVEPAIHLSWVADKNGSGKANIHNHVRIDTSPKLSVLSEPTAFLHSVLNQSYNLADYMILSYVSWMFPALQVVRNQLNSGGLYNINPNRVRDVEDIAQPPGIDADGGGLASTLIALQKQWPAEPDLFTSFDRNRFSGSALRLITDYIRLASEDFDSISARRDPVENRIRAYLRFRDPTLNELPLSLVSDGSAKWFALVTALVTNNTAFCIEEPENFLHPKLQDQIVTIARALSEILSYDRFVLMTTHSQTLLNALEPDEVVVTSRSTFKSACRRPLNALHLAELIQETGFGLGHFYLTGGIE